MFKKAKIGELCGLMGVVLLVLAASFFDFVICPFRLVFGFSCPGCGLTRASTAMLNGDWAQMWTFHPLAPIILPMVILIFGNLFLQALGWTKRDFLHRIPLPVTIVFGTILVGVWIARMLGWYGCLPDPLPPQDGLLYFLFSHPH